MRVTARSHRVRRGAHAAPRAGLSPGVSRTKMVILLGIVAVSAAAFVAIKKPFGAALARRPQSKAVSFVPLGEFLVNLADRDGLRFLKAEITLEMEGMAPGKRGKHGDSEEDPRTARMRDATVMVLSDATFDDLRASGGKERLKERLKAEISEELGDAQVRNVLFTSFVMQ